MNIFLAFLLCYFSAGQDYSLKEFTHYRVKTHPNAIQKFTIAHSKLRSDTKYEVRLSYLGTLGAGFSIYWEPCSPTPTRKMLDTEKLVFSTDTQGKILGLEECEDYIVNIKARRESKGRSIEVENGEIWYDVILEPYSNVIPVPYSVITLIVVIAVMILVCCAMYYSTIKAFNIKPSLSKQE